MKHAKKVDPLIDWIDANPEEAVETLQQLWTPGQAATAPALDLGAECIRRLLISEKVRFIDESENNNRWENQNQYRCPTCNRRLRQTQKDLHCPACGQLLDWNI